MGATEWLVLSCTVVRIENDIAQIQWIRDIQARFRTVQRPQIHFKDLTPAKREIATEVLSEKPFCGFVVMSNKKNIVQYNNKNIKDGNRNWLYWFLCRILLERVTGLCGRIADREGLQDAKLRIVFSKRGRMPYDEFVEYLRKLKEQSISESLYLNSGDLDWRLVDFEEIVVRRHEEMAGLQISDIVASSFFHAVERDRPDECNPLYAKKLKPIMAKSRGLHLEFGVKTMPELWRMDLKPTQREIFVEYGFPPNGWDI